MLVDTDVLIWYLRGNNKSRITLDNLREFSISCVTYLEIVQGLRNKEELRSWKSFLRDRGVRHILIDQDVAAKAIFWMEEFSLSHKLRMADALIGATADIYGLDLLTGNHDDYRFLPGLVLKKFEPK